MDDSLIEEDISDHMMSIEESSTIKQACQQDGTMDCLYYIENVGRFDLACSEMEHIGDTGLNLMIGEMQCVQSDETTLEDEWQHAYELRKQQWKKHTLEQAQGAMTVNLATSDEPSVITDREAL